MLFLMFPYCSVFSNEYWTRNALYTFHRTKISRCRREEIPLFLGNRCGILMDRKQQGRGMVPPLSGMESIKRGGEYG
jgi:hypothetical protein